MDNLAALELDRLADEASWGAYARVLAHHGPGWWFRMDIPELDRHLRRLLARQSAGLSPRLRLLEGIVTPLPGAEKLPAVLRTLAALHRVLLAKRDAEGAAVCAGLALAAVWDFGTDFCLAEPWLRRARALLARRGLAALARAHLLAFCGLFELFCRGNAAAACSLLEAQARAAAEADCPELALYGAAVRAMAELFAGEADRAELLHRDASGLLERASPTSHAVVYFDMVGGVLANAAGRPREALEALEAAAARLPEASMPVSMSLQLAGYGLMAAALLPDGDRARRLEDTVRRLALADRNHLHAAFLHFSLGMGYLRGRRPYRALLHGQEGVRAGVASGSPIPAFFGQLLVGQALLEVNETEEARAALESVAERAGAKGLAFFHRAATVELADLALGRGDGERARRLLEVAGFRTERGGIFSPFRTHEANDRLRQRLDPPRAATWASGPECPIQVKTLGNFGVSVEARPVYDRHWGSGRTQRLLKVLVAMGGTKVSASELAGELWPDASGDHAYANLKTSLSRLRRLGAVPGEAPLRWIHLKWGRISLSTALVGVDALHFRQSIERLRRTPSPAELCEALERYTGPFLPQDDHCAVIGRFRRELQEAFVWVAQELTASSARGEVAVDLVAHLSRAIALAPDAERLYALKMRALLGAGYRLDALRTYGEAEAYFREAFGVAPGSELRSLREAAAG